MSININWSNANQDLLPPDENKSHLPPLADEVFDGEKESHEIHFVKCQHDLYAVSANEVRCRRCSVCWQGAGVTALLQSPK